MIRHNNRAQDIKLNRSIRKLKCNFYSSTNYGCGDRKKTLEKGVNRQLIKHVGVQHSNMTNGILIINIVFALLLYRNHIDHVILN